MSTPPLEYTAIRVSTLRGDMKTPFDVYVRVAGKYILYCRAGSSFEGERLARLKSKKLKKMYIRPEDEIPYAQYMEQNIDAAYDAKSGKSLDVRAEVIQGFQQAAAEQYMEDPTHEMYYNHVRSSMERFVNFLNNDPKASASVLKIENLDQSITHHSVNVATLATMMVAESKFKDSTQIDRLAMGCLLHDIDHVQTELQVAKPVDQMTPEELAIYKEHPLLGAKKLQRIEFVDQLVMNVVLQHEENIKGTGFPKGLTEREMDPMVVIAATANAYDRLVSFEKLLPRDAIKHMMIEKLGLYPLDYLQILQKILKRLGLA